MAATAAEAASLAGRHVSVVKKRLTLSITSVIIRGVYRRNR